MSSICLICASVVVPVHSTNDIHTVEPQDLSEDLNFDDLVRHINDGKRNLGFALMAVETFTADLPGNTAPHVYGFRDVTTEDKENIRKETLLTLRIANMMDVLRRRGIPWVIGAPVRAVRRLRM